VNLRREKRQRRTERQKAKTAKKTAPTRQKKKERAKGVKLRGRKGKSQAPATTILKKKAGCVNGRDSCSESGDEESDDDEGEKDGRGVTKEQNLVRHLLSNH